MAVNRLLSLFLVVTFHFPFKIAVSQINPVDSTALADFYEKTFGNEWKINSGWISEPVGSWYGVKLDGGGKVIGLYLPDNGLKGQIPPSIKDLTTLHILDVSDNEIEGSLPIEFAFIHSVIVDITNNNISDLPDFSIIQRKFNLLASGNKLDFGDIIPNLAVYQFTYSDQDSIGKSKIKYANLGADFEYVLNTSGEGNLYQWFLDGLSLEGQKSNHLVVQNFDKSDIGKYHCEITNPLVTDLKLISSILDLGGQVSISGIIPEAGTNTLPKGEIRFYKIQPGKAFDYVSIPLETDGTFNSDEIPLGNYLIWANPGSNEVGLLPSYISDIETWNEASSTSIQSNMNNIIFNFSRFIAITGNNTIQGKINNNTSLQEILENIPILLFKQVSEIKTLVDFKLSDDLGNFHFNNLDKGFYYLRAEIPGLPMESRASQGFTLSNNDELNLIFTIGNTEIKLKEMLITAINKQIAGDWKIYPNPSGQFVKVESLQNQDFKIIIRDLYGRKLLTDYFRKESIIQLAKFKPGIYFINIWDDYGNRIITRKLIVNK